MSPRTIFNSAIEGIKQADFVIAIVDGSDPDSGTSFECGRAHAAGIPIVAVRTDFRRSGDDPVANVNLMLSQAATVVVETRTKTAPHGDVVELA